MFFLTLPAARATAPDAEATFIAACAAVGSAWSSW